MDFGLLILRVVVGALMIGHGTQKLFGWFRGPGIRGASGFVGLRGFSPASFWTIVGSLSEAVGGLFLALGFLNPLGPIAIATAMLTTIVSFHWPKLWATEGGFEYPLVILASAFAVGIPGPGAYSLDAVLGTSLPVPATVVLVVLGALGFLVGNIGAGTRRAAAQGASQEQAAQTPAGR